jgi:hypothetical protein
MLALLFATTLFGLSPQDPAAAEAVAIRGTAELSVAAAFAAAEEKAADHLRDRWQRRAERAVALRRPFWLPSVLVDDHVRRWLADLPAQRYLRVVDREDRERAHEFGSSFQTTLWIAEEPHLVAAGEQNLRALLRQLERSTALRYGGIVAGWAVLAVLLGWLDRLSRGYMTVRLRLLGLACGAAFPVIAFLL